MGRRDRERVQRIVSGLEAPVKEKLIGAAVGVVQRQSTNEQIGLLNQAIGENRLRPSLLRTQLEKKAPIEMRKGIEKLVKRGKTPTVDLLLEDYRRETAFQKLAAGVGLDEQWFVNLAETELAEWTKTCQQKEAAAKQEQECRVELVALETPTVKQRHAHSTQPTQAEAVSRSSLWTRLKRLFS